MPAPLTFSQPRSPSCPPGSGRRWPGSGCRLAGITTLALLALGLWSPCEAQRYTVTVSAGAFDRLETPVVFHLPDAVPAGTYAMTGGTGRPVPLQIDGDGRAWFILDDLPAGRTVAYRLEASPAPRGSGASAVSYQIDENTIAFHSEEREVLRYIHGVNEPPDFLDERYRRGGYIHPVYSPEEVLLSDHLHPDHPHHSGIWSAWTNTVFEGRRPDFWNVHLNTGRVDQVGGLEDAWEGPVQAGFRARHQFIDLSASAPTVALNERWEVTVYGVSPSAGHHMFDLVVTQTANTDRPLLLPEYRYGGVGFRGHVDWNDPEKMQFLTSDGLGRDGHGTRVRWTHVGGTSEGELAGIAILGHPSNFRHPQTVRIHPDEPFFNFAPAQLGDMAIEPGAPYVSRYRYVTYDGSPSREKLDRLWNDYAYPPAVTVTVR